MFNIKLINLYKNQNGQSLFEFILVIPIFFITLSGILFLFSLQIRNSIDQNTAHNFAISSLYFSNEERNLQKWFEQKDKENILYTILNNSLNASVFFKNSVDMKDGVFFDKKYIKNEDHLNSSSQQSSFDFQTESSLNGYERSLFNFKQSFDLTKNFKNTYSGQSLYYTKNMSNYEDRDRLSQNAISIFRRSLNYEDFSYNVASIYASSPINFNQNCFMATSKKTCSTKLVDLKFSRAAKQSAGLQTMACYAEITIHCAALTIGMLACLEEQTLELINDLKFGMAPMNLCPIACNIINKNQKVVFLHALKNSSEQLILENYFRLFTLK